MDIQVTICRRESGIDKVGRIKSGKFRPLLGHTPVSLTSRTPMGSAFKGRSRTGTKSVERSQDQIVTSFEQEAFLIERRES